MPTGHRQWSPNKSELSLAKGPGKQPHSNTLKKITALYNQIIEEKTMAPLPSKIKYTEPRLPCLTGCKDGSQVPHWGGDTEGLSSPTTHTLSGNHLQTWSFQPPTQLWCIPLSLHGLDYRRPSRQFQDVERCPAIIQPTHISHPPNPVCQWRPCRDQ